MSRYYKSVAILFDAEFLVIGFPQIGLVLVLPNYFAKVVSRTFKVFRLRVESGLRQ